MKRASQDEQSGGKVPKLSGRSLTKDEAAVYDRQLRVWGVAAQQKMLNSRLLVVGMGGVSCEVCKNVILAGLGSVTLMDHECVVGRDLSSNYFLSEADVGSNRAEASRDGAAALNPFVNVECSKEDAALQDSKFFETFDLVVVSRRSLADQRKINDACRCVATSAA